MPSATGPSQSTFNVAKVEKSSDDKTDHGAIVTGIDLNDISDEDVAKLRDSIWRHKVVVVKDQAGLEPIKQWELVLRFDPEAVNANTHGDAKTFKKRGGFLSKAVEVFGIPGAENVRLVAKGYLGEDHYGIKNQTVKGLSNDFHVRDVEPERFARGETRFQRWHIDAPLFIRDPAWFTTLRAIKLPEGPDVTINWDDGSGYSKTSKPGLTAFFSGTQLYSLLTDEEKRLADHSWVEYAPYPYQWIENCKGNTTGLGLVTQGKEHTIEELGEWDPKLVKRYPFVWLNPLTGEKAFQVHGICARKLFLRSGPDEEPRVVDDLVEIRAFLHDIQSRVLKPEYIFLPEIEEGDIVMWDNCGLFHTAIDYPESYGPRIMHQTNLGASRPPRGPVEIPSQV